jgi:hypothetical protein
LSRGRSYDQIAELLSIDRAAVRQRALWALDQLGPHTDVPAESRSLITDYLLGQLPAGVTAMARDRLASSPADRAWARVVASELAPMAGGGLPEIPTECDRAEPLGSPERVPVGVAAAQGASAAPETRARISAAPAQAPAAPPSAGRAGDGGRPERPVIRRSSRRGGALLLGALALAIIAVIVILLVTSGGSGKPTTTSAAARTTSTTTAASAGGTPQILGQINMKPTATGSNAKAAAFVVRQGTTTAIVIQGQSIPANSKGDAYAVWLYNSPSDSHFLGFVRPGVGSNGRLSTAGALPPNASRYKQLLVTLETTSRPRQPGKIVLQGTLTGVS